MTCNLCMEEEGICTFCPPEESSEIPTQQTALYWRTKYLEMLVAVREANKGIIRLRNKLDYHKERKEIVVEFGEKEEGPKVPCCFYQENFSDWCTAKGNTCKYLKSHSKGLSYRFCPLEEKGSIRVRAYKRKEK